MYEELQTKTDDIIELMIQAWAQIRTGLVSATSSEGINANSAIQDLKAISTIYIGKKLLGMTPDICVFRSEPYCEDIQGHSKAWYVNGLSNTTMVRKERSLDNVCLSVGLVLEGQPQIGVVYYPGWNIAIATYGPEDACIWDYDAKGGILTPRAETISLLQASITDQTKTLITAAKNSAEFLGSPESEFDVQHARGFAQKFGYLACGMANITDCAYETPANIAAFDAILRRAGCAVIDTKNGGPANYRLPFVNGAYVGGRPEILARHGFISGAAGTTPLPQTPVLTQEAAPTPP